jgi:hypothetical protein
MNSHQRRIKQRMRIRTYKDTLSRFLHDAQHLNFSSDRRVLIIPLDRMEERK